MMRRTQSTDRASLGPAAAALVLCLVAASAVAAESPAPDEPAVLNPSTAPDQPAVGGSVAAAPAFWGGLWVFVDPATGQISSQPTAEQAAWRRSRATPNPMLNKSSDGLVPFALEDGGRGFALKGRFRHSLSVTLQPDGTFATHCSDHPDAVAGHDHAVEAAAAPEAPVQ